MGQDITIGEISQRLAASIDGLVQKLFPAAVQDGGEWRIGSLAGEAGKSMGIHRLGGKAGVWQDFASGETGDAFDLVAQALYAGDKRQAARWSLDWLGIGDGHDAPSRPAPAAASAPKPEKDWSARALAMWLAGEASLRGTRADVYLRGRGIDLGRLGRQPRCLRYDPSLYNAESNRRWPAILAAICGPDGKHIATHRTWLAHDGHAKAPVGASKMTLGRYTGGCIRLWRGSSGMPLDQAPHGETVVITEGIEDGLSVALAVPNLRVLVAVSLSNMGALKLPAAIRYVLQCVDNDTGDSARRGAERATQNFQQQGKYVSLVRSPIGKDMNDLLRAVRGEA